MGVRAAATAAAAALVFCLMAAQQTDGQHYRQGDDNDDNNIDNVKCGQAADMVFVLDVSSSIWEVDFKKHVLTFVSNVSNELNVGPGESNSRVAAITFGTTVNREFLLKDHTKKEDLLPAIKKIRKRIGSTNTHLALKYVDDFVFKPSAGARTNVSRVVVVITDGVSRKAEATREAARVLREHGAIIFAIGVGRDLDRRQLADMASRPAKEYVIKLTKFKNLDKRIKDKLVYKACQATTTTTTTTTTPSTTTIFTTTPTTTTTTTSTTTTTTPVSSTSGAPVSPLNDRPADEVDAGACVNLAADVFFVLDSSSSIWEEDFYNGMLKFVREVIKMYDVGPGRTRVGVITYSTGAEKIFGLKEFDSHEELEKAIKNKVAYKPGVTNTALALKEADDQLRVEGRPRVQQVIILITDGQSRDPDSTVATARALRNRGVSVLAVGVGEAVDERELQEVTGSNTVMMVGGFQSLDQYSSQLAARSCAPNDEGDASGIPINDEPSADGCVLGKADVIFAYDWSTLGSQVISHLTSTLHELTVTLTARGADVRLGIVTSRACLRQLGVPLSSGEVLRKYTRRVVRSQLHRVLRTVRESAFTASYNHRPGARKMLVMVLDPASNSVSRQLALEAAKVRNAGVEIFVLTPGASRQGAYRLQDMVSPPAWGHAIPLPGLDLSDHVHVSGTIANYLCGDTRAIYHV